MIQFDERAYFSNGLKLNHQLVLNDLRIACKVCGLVDLDGFGVNLAMKKNKSPRIIPFVNHAF